MEKVDWRALVFETGWLQKLDKLAVRRFGAGGLAEEASTYVINRISDKQWAVLCKFQGQSKPETYLYTIASNFLEEFSRERFGRPRPPEWVKREGELWVRIWRAVCLDRQEIETIVDRESECEPGVTAAMVRRIAKMVRARAMAQVQGLREFGMPRPRDEEAASVEETLIEHNTPESALFDADYEELVALMAALLDDNEAAKHPNLYRQLGVSGEEAAALRLVYEDGERRNAVARRLGVAAHVPGRMINKTLARLRAVLEARGAKGEALKERLV